MAFQLFTRLEDLIKNSASNPITATPSQVLADIGSPSTSIAVLDNGEISSHCISTGSDNPDTLFQACSISKPVAGLAIMKLIELGHFSLDDKICDLLPDQIVQLMAIDSRTERLLRTVTIKHLMSHTSGISVGGFPGYPVYDRVPQLYQIFEGRSSANTQPIVMKTLPGLEFMYSGGGITVLQCVVENVMQKPLAELVKEHVFDPLGMTRSCYYVGLDEQNVAKAHYHGYYPTEIKWHVQPELAAAGLWTTPTDLMKVVRAVQESLEGNKPNTILRKESAELMLTKIKGDFGLTWLADGISFGHSGSNNPGYRCFTFGFADLPWNNEPTAGQLKQEAQIAIPLMCGISVMTNAVTGDNVWLKIVSAVAYLKGWTAPSGHIAGDHFTMTPFPAFEESYASDEWMNWIGNSWSDGWMIAKDDKDNPVAGIDHEVLVKLRPAAIPPKQYADGKKSIDFVMDGISILVRLSWDGPDRTIETCNFGTQEVKVLRNTSNAT
ncbi:hypothetical protein H2198_009521 [Neophaeococcomyces mojaviensis]|uniref:Uncharacterized protein n=1 Tax=Neophaeococcomyces mojaviensis TaxID=3383035 RepID=A0ACC2ZUF8_9EURO|nr:hypothetical protein H2198_009521 [Knufia sp. JES_112]